MTPLASHALNTARAAWPDIALDDAVFVEHLERYAGDEQELDIAAIYLGCACLHGEPHALASFEQQYLDPIPRQLSRISSDPGLHDEVKQRLRIKLFVGPEPAITKYRRGSLAAWLRVIATRIAIDLLRAKDQPLQEPPLELAALADDANLILLKEQYREHVEVAFVAAITALAATDRAMLRLAFVDGVGLEGIGKIYQLSKSAVSRRLSKCRSDLLADVKQRLGIDLGIGQSELDSIVQLVRSQLHLSLPRLLAK